MARQIYFWTFRRVGGRREEGVDARVCWGREERRCPWRKAVPAEVLPSIFIQPSSCAHLPGWLGQSIRSADCTRRCLAVRRDERLQEREMLHHLRRSRLLLIANRLL